MKKAKTYKFNHEEQMEYHRRQSAVVYDFIQYIKAEKTVSDVGFKHSRAELISALYDVMFAAHRQMDYRQRLHDLRELEKKNTERVPWYKKFFVCL